MDNAVIFKHRGQISLEFLVVICITFALLILFMPIYTKIYDNSLLSLDYFQATKFANEFEKNTALLNTMSDDSYFIQRFDPLNKIELQCSDRNFSLMVIRKSLSKNISRVLPAECDGSLQIESYTEIKISKENKIIKVEKNN